MFIMVLYNVLLVSLWGEMAPTRGPGFRAGEPEIYVVRLSQQRALKCCVIS